MTTNYTMKKPAAKTSTNSIDFLQDGQACRNNMQDSAQFNIRKLRPTFNSKHAIKKKLKR